MSNQALANRVVVVSAPSGTGKTTLNRRLLREYHDKISMSVSYTARQPRQGDTDGVDYHFVSQAEFKALIAKGEMLEYAEVFGTLYGTARTEIERIKKSGKIALLEIDVQGWRQAREKLTHANSIFILPPSVEALWQRLESRGTEPKDVRWRRLMAARNEVSSGSLYDCFIVNNNLEDAYKELAGIIIDGVPAKVGNDAGTALCQKLLHEFDHAGWIQKLSKELANK